MCPVSSSSTCFVLYMNDERLSPAVLCNVFVVYLVQLSNSPANNSVEYVSVPMSSKVHCSTKLEWWNICSNSGNFSTILMWKINHTTIQMIMVTCVLVFVFQLHQQLLYWWRNFIKQPRSWTRNTYIHTYIQTCCADEKFDKIGATSEQSPSNP
jgi:hypothetical protein